MFLAEIFAHKQNLFQLDPQNLDRLITGRKPVLQILLDQKREHYVLVERTLVDDTVIVFDSLATSRKKAKNAVGYRFEVSKSYI